MLREYFHPEGIPGAPRSGVSHKYHHVYPQQYVFSTTAEERIKVEGRRLARYTQALLAGLRSSRIELVYYPRDCPENSVSRYQHSGLSPRHALERLSRVESECSHLAHVCIHPTKKTTGEVVSLDESKFIFSSHIKKKIQRNLETSISLESSSCKATCRYHDRFVSLAENYVKKSSMA